MSEPTEVQDYLNQLLVTDRAALLFLGHTLLNLGPATAAGPAPNVEEVAVDLARHVRLNAGHAPRPLVQWLGSISKLSRNQQIAAVRLSGYYRDPALVPLYRSILDQLVWVAVHPAAVTALAQTLGFEASRALSDLLWSTPPARWHLRETAILRELGRLGWSSSIDPLRKALGTPHDLHRRAAAAALARFSSEEVLPALIASLESPDPRQAEGAAESLGLLGDKAAKSALQRAATARAPGLACAAAVALARLGDGGAQAQLSQLAREDHGHEGAELRAKAAEALGVLGGSASLSPEARLALVAALGDSQPEVRQAAARAAGRTLGEDAVARLQEQAKREPSPLVRAAMLQALGAIGSPSSLPLLLDMLKNSSRDLKIEVLLALGEFPNPKLAQHINPHRASPDVGVAEAAESALRRLMHTEFAWPPPVAPGEPVEVELYAHADAQVLLLPPTPAAPVGWLGRLLGKKDAPEAHGPVPVGTLKADAQGLEAVPAPGAGWTGGKIAWDKRFSVHVTREPVEAQQREDTGVHFTLRQRLGEAVAFEAVHFSLWCAPTPAVGRLQAKRERFACLDPHRFEPLLANLRYAMELHGERLPLSEE